MSEPIDIVKKNLKVKPSDSAILDYGKLPPQAVEIEKNVLGCVMMDADALKTALKYCSEDLFYMDCNQRLWRAIRSVKEADIEVDILTVTEQLKKTEELDLVGGAYYVAKLTSDAIALKNIKFHLLILFEKFMQRQMITYGSMVVRDCYADNADVFDLCEQAINNFTELLTRAKGNRRKKLKEVLDETTLDIRNRIKGIRRSMFHTGWTEFDDIVALDKPQIVVIPSNRKIGKTALMLSLAQHIIERNDNTAWKWFTLEMSAADCVRRFISMETGLTDSQLLSKDYKLTSAQAKDIAKAREKIEGYPIEFEEECKGIIDVKVKFEAFCKENEGKDCFLVLDNHGYVIDKADNEENICKEYVKIKSVTGGVLFILHHITTKGVRDFNIDNGYEPLMDMIRGNTRLLDYCTILLLLHRPNLYKDLMHRLKLELTPERYHMIDKLFLVHCALNRSGNTGYIRLQHDISTNSFSNFKK